MHVENVPFKMNLETFRYVLVIVCYSKLDAPNMAIRPKHTTDIRIIYTGLSHLYIDLHVLVFSKVVVKGVLFTTLFTRACCLPHCLQGSVAYHIVDKRLLFTTLFTREC